MGKLRNFLSIRREERALFFEGILLMSAVRLGLLFASTQRVVRWLDALERRGSQHPASVPIPVRRAARRLRQAAKFCPLPVTCLAEALAAKALMARYGHSGTLRIGVLKSGDKLRAHAWLECSGGILIGSAMPDGKQYTLLAGAERLAG